MNSSLSIVVEGDTDLPVARKLAQDADFEISGEYDFRGKSEILKRLDGLNGGARSHPWLVLCDLDSDAACAPEFIEEQGFSAAKWMCFRIAVREMEAWLLADHGALAEYLRIPARQIPPQPDDEPDPKRRLVSLADMSPSRAIRKGMVPRPGTGTLVGPEYESRMIIPALASVDLLRTIPAAASRRASSLPRSKYRRVFLGRSLRAPTRSDSPGTPSLAQPRRALGLEFATRHWRLDRACRRSPSLTRARAALHELARRWSAHVRGA